MKKIIWIVLILVGLGAYLNAAIVISPAGSPIYVGQQMTARVTCYYGISCTMYWGDGSSKSFDVDYVIYSTPAPHTYRNPGTFTLHFHRNGSTGCPQDEYATVTVLENRSITLSTTQPGVGIPITFTAVNFQTPANITWDMGDGTTYAHQDNTVTHTYQKTGNFTVRAFDWNGSTATTPITLALSFKRSISYSPALPLVDQPVDIRAIAFGSDTIDWNFGDGTAPLVLSTAVSHRYLNPGTFNITALEHNAVNVGPESRAITILPENRSLSLSVLEAKIDEPVTVTALNFRGPQVLWDFGDGSIASGPGSIASFGSRAGISGPVVMTHAYKLPGNYTITARDENGASEKRFQALIRILGISDQVNLELAEITLDNGKYYKVVPKNSKDIHAQLRMKMRGTGIVSGYWIVDGQPYQFFNETVYQGQIKIIITPDVPGLPVFDPGMHTITVQLTRPAEEVIFPTMRYFVLPYENQIATLAPRDGAVIKEDEVAEFAWESALGGSYYQIAFADSLFPLIRNEETLKWLDCPDRFRFTPDAETWKALPRNQWVFWKVRARDSGKNIVAESGIQEMKIIVPGAKIGIQKITDMDGKPVAIGSAFTAARAEQLLIHGSLTYPAAAEYLIVRVYAGEDLVDQLLFRAMRKDEARLFETSVPNGPGESRVTFQVLKSSSPSVLVGYQELLLKKE